MAKVMKNHTYVLGINSVYHDSSACLLEDGGLIVAIEEERFSRIKHAKKAQVDNGNILPVHAIRYCLQSAGIEFHDLKCIALAFDPKLRLQNIGVDLYYEPGDWGSEEGEQLFYKLVKKIPSELSKLAGEDIRRKIKWIPHHLCHAASAYFVSPFPDAAILSIDGIGEYTSTWLGKGTGDQMEVLKEMRYPNSIGFLWEKVSEFLGFSKYDASKVMGLAAYGDSEKYYPQFKALVSFQIPGEFSVDNTILQFRKSDFQPLERFFEVQRISDPSKRTKDHEDIAAGLQSITDDIFLHLTKYLAEETGSHNLCMAGGVVLNCTANAAVWKSGFFERLYIQPAANDAGTALGATFYVWNQLQRNPRSFTMAHAYWGPSFSDKEIQDVLEKENVHFEYRDDIENATAKLLSEGKIIGWFQGKMEWGPRALGNRSLLVDPRQEGVRKILNERIKKRESFRPFAPSVLEEQAEQWFEIPACTSSLSTGFMLFAFNVKEDKRKLIPAVVHRDGTSRIQIVSKKSNPKYHKLLSAFYRFTDVPMVLNTSLNENEPIVCTPLDAVRTLKKTKMDYLVLNNFLCRYT